jgi:gas vesicle protein
MEIRNGSMRHFGLFVAGGLLGAGIACLVTPYSGRRTRRNLLHFGKKVLHKSEAVGMDLRNSLDNLVDTVSDKLSTGVARGREWARRA